MMSAAMSAFSPRHCARHYRDTGLRARVSEAGPHQLIALLLEGACQRIELATASLERGDLARKGQAIAGACAIIAHLGQTLDRAAGGDIADNLSSLYDWMLGHLTQANADNDSGALRDAHDVLSQIRSGWAGIAAG